MVESLAYLDCTALPSLAVDGRPRYSETASRTATRFQWDHLEEAVAISLCKRRGQVQIAHGVACAD